GALPARGVLERAAIPRCVGEGDGSYRGQRDAGLAVCAYEGFSRLRLTDGADRARQSLGDLAVSVEGRELLAESASLQHGAVERQGQVTRELAAKRRESAGRVVRDREWDGRDDLESGERLSGARATTAERRHRDVFHIVRRAEPEDDPVGDLAGELEHLARQRGQVDRRRRRALGNREAPAHLVVPALESGRPAERAPQHADVLSPDRQRLAP